MNEPQEKRFKRYSEASKKGWKNRKKKTTGILNKKVCDCTIKELLTYLKPFLKGN